MTSSIQYRSRVASGTPADLVDLDRYPITELDSAKGRMLIRDVRRAMDETCICALPEFLRPEALARMVQEAETLVPLAYRGPTEASPYFFNYGTDQLGAL